jgi:hypothetical protein
MNTEHRWDVWRRALGIAAILLVGAAGFCWFDSLDDEHGAAGVVVAAVSRRCSRS